MTGPIHICHVLLSLRPGGLENGVVNVVNRLDPLRFRSSICCLQTAGEFARRIRRTGVSIDEMGLRKGNDPWLPIRLARLFRQRGADVVHTRNAEAFFYGVLGARLAGVRTVIHSEHGRTLPDRLHRMLLQRWLTHCTDAIFAVSEQLKHDLVEYVRIPPARIEILYNGVDLARFAAGDRGAARTRLGARENVLLVGSVGRLVPVKNYDLLVRALEGLLGIDLALIGDGPEHDALAARAAAAGLSNRVHFLGHRDDVAELLSGLDVFVLPSVSEGMSNTLLEAMASGLPVVASRVGGNSEIIHDGRDGMLFASGDLAGLRDALGRLRDDASLRARLGVAGALRARTDFGMDAMIERYEALYARTTMQGGGRWRCA